MKKIILLGTTSLIGITFVTFQNFSYELTDLKLVEHISNKQFYSNDNDFVAKTPPNSQACKIDAFAGDQDKIIYNQKGEVEKIIFLNPNEAQTRTIKLYPENCHLNASLEIASSNIELNCNQAFINGDVFQGRNVSGVIISKEANFKIQNGKIVYFPIVISYELAQVLLQDGYKGVNTNNYTTNLSDLIQYANQSKQDLKNLIYSYLRIENVKVLNCKIRNFPNNGIHVNWNMLDNDKVKLFPNFEERKLIGPRNISIVSNQIKNSGNSGVYFDDHVNGSSIFQNAILGSRSTGIYLEYHSHNNTISKNKIYKNGYTFTNDPNLASRIREGLAIDGSFDNQITSNAFWDNGIGAIFTYKNCGENLAGSTPFTARREFGANNNIISENIFLREKRGIFIASRQDANLIKQRCSDETPYTNQGFLKDITGDLQGPFNLFFKDFSQENTISKNTFHDVAIAIKIADDNNIVDSNIFKGSSATLIEIGLTNRFRFLKEPIKNITISNNISNVTPSANYSLYNYINHPMNAQFLNNYQGKLKTCQPVTNIRAINNSKKTCTMYLNKGDLSLDSVSTFTDRTPNNIPGGTFGTADFQCIDGKLITLRNNCQFKD